jgi:predicted phosphodiesterase
MDISGICKHRKVIVVGDIHGCFDEFRALLKECNYNDMDIVVATGDLVDRGPKIREVLTWFYVTSYAFSVMGNHDNKLIRYWKGNPVQINHGLDKTIEQMDGVGDHGIEALSQWITHWPHMIRLANMDGKPVYVVHAGVDGRKPIESQRIETCLYARYLDGKNFFDEQGIPWWETLIGDYTVISGHIRTDDVHPCEHAYCIDGGAHEGGKLRALVITNGQCNIHEVPGRSE